MTMNVIIAEILCKNYQSYFDYIEIHPNFIEELADRGIYEVIESIVNRRISLNKGKAQLQKKIGVRSKDWKDIGFWMNKILEKQGKSKIVTSISLTPELHRVLDDYKTSGGNRSLFFHYAALEVFKTYGRTPSKIKQFVNKCLGVDYKEDKQKEEMDEDDVLEIINSIKEDRKEINKKTPSFDDLDEYSEDVEEFSADEMREILQTPNGYDQLLKKNVPKAFLDRLSKQ